MQDGRPLSCGKLPDIGRIADGVWLCPRGAAGRLAIPGPPPAREWQAAGGELGADTDRLYAVGGEVGG